MGAAYSSRESYARERDFGRAAFAVFWGTRTVDDPGGGVDVPWTSFATGPPYSFLAILVAHAQSEDQALAPCWARS